MIDNYDFWEMDAAKYFSFPKKYIKAEKKEKAKYLCLSGSYLGSRKMDGVWSMILRDNDGSYHLRSRQRTVDGIYLDKAEWIPQIIEELNIPAGTVLLGEIYLPKKEGSRNTTSILNCLKEKSLERQKIEENKLCFYCFDILAWDGNSLLKTCFEDRINYLNKINTNSPYISVANYLEGQELWDEYNKILAIGGEGIVITKKTSHYTPGKRPAWETLKLKKELEDSIDAFLTGNYREPKMEYTGKNIQNWDYWKNVKTGQIYTENQYDLYLDGVPLIPVTQYYALGWAGAVEFAVLKDGKEVSVGYISGIEDSLRKDIVVNSEKYKGKVAQITAMELQDVNNNGHKTFRHGSIECWRPDKLTSDCLYEQLL